jgi:hypothetical protein
MPSLTYVFWWYKIQCKVDNFLFFFFSLFLPSFLPFFLPSFLLSLSSFLTYLLPPSFFSSLFFFLPFFHPMFIYISCGNPFHLWSQTKHIQWSFLFPSFFFVLWYWSLNSVSQAFYEGSLPLEPYPSPLLL